MSLVQALEAWNALPNSFRVVQTWPDGQDAWHAELLTTNSTAVPDLALSAQQVVQDDRVFVSLSVPLPAQVAALSGESEGFAYEVRDSIAATGLSRPGLVMCSLQTNDGGVTLEFGTVIYGDGFTRHALNAAVEEIVKAYAAVERRLDELMIAAQISAATATSDLACPSCGHVNPPESRFCNQCGTALTDGA